MEISIKIEGVTPNHLQALNIPVEPPWCGIRQHTFEELAASLIAFTSICACRPELRAFCRKIVIQAKDRARATSRNARLDQRKRLTKIEMTEWMLVWLGDPALFPAWVSLRMRAVAAGI